MVTNEDYIGQKHIFLILFSPLEKNLDECKWITDLVSLESMRVILAYLTSKNCLSDKIKDRVYKYISKSREIKTDNYIERVDILNSMVQLLNSQIFDESYIFYISEFIKRRDIKFNKNLLFTIDNYIDEIESSLTFDYVVIKGHLDVDLNEFYNEYLDYYVENPLFYYESINAISKEVPSILDDNFKKRIKISLEKIYESNKHIGVKLSNKKLMKKLNIKI